MTKCAFIPNFLKFYNILWLAALPFLKRNHRLAPTFDRRVNPRLTRADIWLQAASAGEAFLALSILSRLSLREPFKVLVTTTTAQGLEVLQNGLKNSAPNLSVTLDLFPFDTQKAVAAAVTQVCPKVVVLLETELWPALLHELRQHEIPVLVLNARMSKRSSARYKKTRWLWQCLAPDRILSISREDRDRYAAVFPGTPVDTMDNIKFDVMDAVQQAAPPRDQGPPVLFPGPLPLTIIASFRRQEEVDIMALAGQLKTAVPDQIIALFPRHMHRIKAMKQKLKRRGIDYVLRSELKDAVTRPCVILWDRFGELRQAYSCASAVFVGGSLAPLGGQNFIEPAALGIPTVIGPHWDDFAWVGKEIFTLGVITCVPDAGTAARVMAAHLKQPANIGENREKTERYMASKQGGSDAACTAILRAMSEK
jgi:3-deoxy-D-manno-octulosonic-acid transferase